MFKRLFLFFMLASLLLASCQEQQEHTAPAINPRESVAMMVSYGVNTLISDSGVIKYRIVTERWEINQNRKPSRWIFDKGLFLEQFDQRFHVESYIQCDTAYYYDEKRLWELRGRVHILTKDGLRFSSEQLFWDELSHELYSHVYSKLVTPEREIEGSYFRSDEKMTKYYISNSKGAFVKGDFDSSSDTTATQLPASGDTITQQLRPAPMPQRRNTSIPLMH